MDFSFESKDMKDEEGAKLNVDARHVPTNDKVNVGSVDRFLSSP